MRYRPLTTTRVDVVMADSDIPAQEPLSNKNLLELAPSQFEEWAAREGYNITPAVSPCPRHSYADSNTQEAFEAWNGGAGYVARMVTESTLETEAQREKLQALACGKQTCLIKLI
jgi:hypothetical protein